MDDEMMMNNKGNESRILAAHYGTKTPSMAPISAGMPIHFGFTFPASSIFVRCPVRWSRTTLCDCRRTVDCRPTKP
jgi:hypothetical protein